MSLPEYKAIGFQEILERGGHSKPWIVLVDLEGMAKPYVVKLYKTIDIEARNKMTAEVLGNVLAAEFDLNAPPAAIIDFTPEFRMQLNSECENVLQQIDERPKFGSEYIEGSFIYTSTLDREYVKELINPATLYAYDYFICNGDRTFNKPNLLIKGSDAYVIDHEMALNIKPFCDNIRERIQNDGFEYHVFHKFLTKYRDKEHLFDEFIESLYHLNLQHIDSYFSQLEGLGFDTQKDLIISYWQAIKEKPSIFVEILRTSIQ